MVDPGTLAVVNWLWEQFGKKIIASSSGTIKDTWKKVNWTSAEEKYRSRIIEQLSVIRLLGYPDPIDIGSIYTDVQVLSKLTAKKRFNFDDLKGKPFDFDIFNSNTQRFSALDVAVENKRIYILGKPGAGKTTFLRYLAILACRGEIKATPIYISLKEWSDSQKKLFNYIEDKFEICGFPDAKKMIESILDSGKALVLLDGLDEMNHEEMQQKNLLQEITNFTEKYHKSHFCLTCRIAANDYSFDRFTYVEIADFNELQQNQFIDKWFSLEPTKLRQFDAQWNKPENNKIHDLARTPLLLTLICLSFGETLQFPKRRVDLYSEAVDALLKKWDSSRAIFRGDIYKQLEHTRKKQLLSFIAYNTFTREEYLIRSDVIADEINQFIRKLPYWDKQIEVDAELILRGIESHHGLLVERARNIYSFSHLTIHEYFTALYILDNVANDSLSTLVDNMVTSTRWREVMLMCSSSQSNASQLLAKFARRIWEFVSDDKDIVYLIRSIQSTSYQSLLGNYKGLSPSLNENSNATSYEHALDVAGNLSLLHDDETSHTIVRARKLVKELGYRVGLQLNSKVEQKLNRYLSLTSLFVECLQISSVDNRADLEDMALMDYTRIQ